MRQSTRQRPTSTSRILTRWRGMGAILAVCFYSLYFAAHLKFQNTPIYVQDGMIFGASTQSAFNDLATERKGKHAEISPLHPAFTILHQPIARLCIKFWEVLGQDPGSARKHGVAMLTSIAGALAVVMIYHTLLWAGIPMFRTILLSMCFGASTCIWVLAPLPQPWTFAGLGVVALIAVSARGLLTHQAWYLLAATYAICTFVGSIIPCLIIALMRCAQDHQQTGSFSLRPLAITLAAFTFSFGLANLQRQIYPTSQSLPSTWTAWCQFSKGWESSRDTQAVVAREVFISNIVSPSAVTTQMDKTRKKVVVADSKWTSLDLRRGLSAGWLLILAIAFSGIVWRAQIEPFTLGIIAILMWSIASLEWYGSRDTVLLHACLWTGNVIIAVGLGLERALEHWQRLTTPITLFLAIFVSALITRNWLFLQEIAIMPTR
jgi:hypothetical protein